MITTNEEIIWLDISMDEPLLVNFLNSLDDLHCNEANGLEVESPLALLEEVLETWSKQVHYHHVKLVFLVCLVRADVVQLWHKR